MNNYATLKTRYIELTAVADSILVDFNVPYLMVGIIAPEASNSDNITINKANLKPYEHACRQFANSDFKYSEVDINQAGRREIKGLTEFGNPATFVKFPLIVCYITF